jgi:hypothetical protein
MSTSDHPPVLRVDPGELRDAVRHLHLGAGTLDLIHVEPAAAGDRSTAVAVGAFTGAYRAAVTVLSADDDAAACHLAAADDTYLAHDTFPSPP